MGKAFDTRQLSKCMEYFKVLYSVLYSEASLNVMLNMSVSK